MCSIAELTGFTPEQNINCDPNMDILLVLTSLKMCTIAELTGFTP